MPRVFTTDAPDGTQYELRSTNQQNVLIRAVDVTLTPSARLSTVFFVDKAAAPGGDGSIGRPFNRIALALAALTVPDQALQVAPGDYSSEGIALLPGFACAIIAMGSGFPEPSVRLPQITWPPGAGVVYWLQNVNVELTGQDDALFRCNGCQLALTNSASVARFQIFGCSVFGFADTLEVHDCDMGSVDVETLVASASSSNGNLLTNVSATYRDCRFTAVGQTLTGPTIFYNCNFAPSVGMSLVGPVTWDRVSELSAQRAGVSITQAPTPLDGVPLRYGTGDGGDVTLSASQTADIDLEYRNLTIGVGGKLNCSQGRFAIMVRDLLDLSTANLVGAICDQPAGTPGGNAAGAVGGVGGGGGVGQVDGGPGRPAGLTGATGIAGVGAVAAAPVFSRWQFGGAGSAQTGGAGGNGVAAGGAGGTIGNASLTARLSHMDRVVWSGPDQLPNLAPAVSGGAQGRAGSAGGGDNAAALGGGGGGSAGGGGVVIIYARCIKLSPGLVAGTITCFPNNGGNGGNGAATGGATGGGGGGGSGGGGGVMIFYEWIIGQGPANLITADAGNGGAGGNGANTGQGGTGGQGANGGHIVIYNTLSNTRKNIFGTAGNSGAAPVGTAGGAGGVGGTCSAALP